MSIIKGKLSGIQQVNGTLSGAADVRGDLSTVTDVIADYNILANHPTFNGVEWVGDLTSEDVGLIVDPEVSSTSVNPPQSKAVYEAIANAVEGLELKMPKIKFGTTVYWNTEQIISEENTIYVYTDLRTDSQGRKIAGIRVGDGKAYLSDLPFLDELYFEHINDTTKHITNEEREFWNNKVRCYYSVTDKDMLVFTTD